MSLREEIGKRQPFDSAEQEACLNLIRTCDRLEWTFQRLFRAAGITGPQYNILRILRGNGNPGMPSLKIASQMLTCVPDITRLIDRLEQATLVERRRCEGDRRVVLVFLTPAGTELLESLDRPILDMHAHVFGHFSPEELSELNRLAVKARERLSTGENEPPPNKDLLCSEALDSAEATPHEKVNVSPLRKRKGT